MIHIKFILILAIKKESLKYDNLIIFINLLLEIIMIIKINRNDNDVNYLNNKLEFKLYLNINNLNKY